MIIIFFPAFYQNREQTRRISTYTWKAIQERLYTSLESFPAIFYLSTERQLWDTEKSVRFSC